MLAHSETERERERKLPVWAQARLNSLRHNLAEERAHAAELRGEIETTNTYVGHYTREDQPLPDGARILYHLRPDDGSVRRSVRVYALEDALHVQGDHLITVYPQASNSLVIRFHEDYR
ncbi:DUF7239 family protein [Streptomyces katsurahamanus]|uniref:Uncharacterized protein n=1 Tax=Streptomyces katsurahamanus TaxID=2577098 RepID=A0ABW9P3D9_9ACTN|nr:hypothetical protein [Streptomyces katsurahamanus]MQS40015.1 hypothetical protein [Streptomyces katsurahamanus]